MTGAVRALRALVDQAEFQARGPVPLPEEPPLPEAALRLLQGQGALTEHASRALLAACGLALPPERLARDAAEAAAVAGAIGFPVALKIQSRGIPHKTEAGGVALNLADAAAVRDAFTRMMDSVRHHAPDAVIEGVSVQRMAPRGVECIIGLTRDADFGPMVLCGLGGIHAEVLADTVLAPCPVSVVEAREMILSLRGARLLTGARGAPPADVEALAALLARISEIGVAAGPRLKELDLNPVIVHPEGQGVSIADALAVLEETA
ncbi:acetate--CoA ligase family protein [Siccirubricoccus sp. G192]|uniref:acetate--CoA ligase family protein n=1 Tax=Siccirubricoccus sp. G192 TaxID=2849651 RepID=UPI0020C45C35|nr:acetate--CoA ligase family protein [Siccirubricoccus sp. G192]